MTPAPRRPTVRLHDVSVDGLDDPDAVLAAVRAAVAATLADAAPTQEAVRAAVASAVASAVAGRSRPGG